jgi:hypothetical protein
MDVDQPLSRQEALVSAVNGPDRVTEQTRGPVTGLMARLREPALPDPSDTPKAMTAASKDQGTGDQTVRLPAAGQVSDASARGKTSGGLQIPVPSRGIRTKELSMSVRTPQDGVSRPEPRQAGPAGRS